MGKFCPYCGHPVAEGAVCGCRVKAQKTQQSNGFSPYRPLAPQNNDDNAEQPDSAPRAGRKADEHYSESNDAQDTNQDAAWENAADAQALNQGAARESVGDTQTVNRDNQQENVGDTQTTNCKNHEENTGGAQTASENSRCENQETPGTPPWEAFGNGGENRQNSYANDAPPPRKRRERSAEHMRQASDAAKQGWTELLRLIGKPAEMLEECSKDENVAFGVVLFLIKGVALGMFFSILAGSGGLLAGVRGINFGGLASVFVQTLVVSMIVDVLFCCTVCGVGKLMGAGSSLSCVMSAMGVATLPLTLGLLLSSILGFVSLRIALVILCMAICMFAAMVCSGLESTLRLERNKTVWAMALIFLVVILILWICSDMIFQSALNWIKMFMRLTP